MSAAEVIGGSKEKQKGFEGFGPHQYKEVLEKMFAQADPAWDKKAGYQVEFHQVYYRPQR